MKRFSGRSALPWLMGLLAAALLVSPVCSADAPKVLDSPVETAASVEAAPEAPAVSKAVSEAVIPVKPQAENPVPAVKSPVALAEQAVNDYAERLAAWQGAEKPQSFETVLEKGQQAAAAILAAESLLDTDAFEALGRRMQGYLTVRNELVVIYPDPLFLKEASKKHGLPSDVAFFEVMEQTLNGYWPMTMERLDDLSGCIRYGAQDLVRLYGAWKAYEKQYPEAYRIAFKDSNLLLTGDIEDQLVNGLSACEGPDSAVAEFQAFIAAYPDSPLVPRLKKRIEEIQKDRSDMVFYQGLKYNAAH